MEEHPDVFNDPNFSITQLDSSASEGGLDFVPPVVTPAGGLNSVTPAGGLCSAIPTGGGQSESTMGSEMELSHFRTHDATPVSFLNDFRFNF